MQQPPHRLELALDNLVAAVEAEDHRQEFGLWAVAAVGHRLGITTALSNATHPVEALADIGDDWAEHVSELLDGHPETQANTLRVVHAVVEQVVGDVRRRGLTRGEESRFRA